MLQLAGDLGLLDEPADQLGVVAVGFEQDLHGEVAAEVGITPLEHGAHAAAGDLAEELKASGAIGGVGHLGRRGLDDGAGVGAGIGVAEEDPGKIPEGAGEGFEEARRGGAEGDGQIVPEAGRSRQDGQRPSGESSDGAGGSFGRDWRRPSNELRERIGVSQQAMTEWSREVTPGFREGLKNGRGSGQRRQQRGDLGVDLGRVGDGPGDLVAEQLSDSGREIDGRQP